MGAKGSVLKRVRQSRKANLRNRHFKSKMKTAIKQVLTTANKENISVLLSKAVSTIDKVCSKGIIHKNRAAHHKSSLMRHVNNL